MSRHVAPHRWADAFAGKLAEADVAAMERHADGCESCGRKRDRVQRASQSFPALRAQSAPELPWDSLRARVHWSVSSERNAKLRTSARPRGMIVAGAVAVTAMALAFATGEIAPPRAEEQALVVAPHVTTPAPSARLAVTGLVSRLVGQVMIDGVRPSDGFERVLGVGTVLATAEGRIDVQFGEHSAFALGPGSTLELRRFDAELIELAVQGTVDLTLAPRAPGQRFVVIAGDRTIEVRGTQFRVSHDETSTRVACRHGKVAVRDAAGELEVATARKLEIATNTAVSAARVVALSAVELEQLSQATPATMPLWTNAETLVQSSAALEIATVGKRHVRVDGVELGEAPLRVRVMPGRHTVETADNAGRFRRAGWVDVAAAKTARLAVAAEVAPTGGTAARRNQLRVGIDRARLSRCTRAIAKQGFTNTYVDIEISIDATGAVQFLNVVDTDLPSATSSCVREVLADVRFRAGAAATFRDKIDL